MSRWVIAAILITGCTATIDEATPLDGGTNTTDNDSDAPPPLPPLDHVPTTLAETGWNQVPMQEYEPRWRLWSDGAEKQRWISLPAPIDNSNADYWRFPVGTRLWKAFTRDGVLVETRFMVKYGEADDAWLFMGFDGDGNAQPEGAQNVSGTGHDIPARKTCLGCHANVKSRVLGFSAFQLDYEGLWDLDDANAAGWFTTALPAQNPHYPVPGNAQQQAVLGYFHVNCGHCHNSQSPLVNRPSFRLETDHCASLSGTRTYQTTVNVSGIPYGGATIVAKPGDPDHSIIYTRMHSGDSKKKMPALGSEIQDQAGIAMIRTWIQGL